MEKIRFSCEQWLFEYQSLLANAENRRVSLEINAGTAANSIESLHRYILFIAEAKTDEIQHGRGCWYYCWLDCSG